jgi:outer membrane protein TolC
MKTKHTLKNLFAIALMLLIFPVVNSLGQQASYSFNVQQAVEYALKNQVNVKNAELDARIAVAEKKEVIGIGLPQIKGTADINHFIEIPTSFVPAEFFNGDAGTYAAVQFGQKYSASAGVSATQLLFDGSYIVGLQASDVYTDLSRKNLQRSKIETAVEVSKAYYLVLVSRERFKQLEQDLERVKKLKEDTKALYDNGFVEKIDHDRVELSYNILLSAKNQTERSLLAVERLLKFQIGMDVNANLELTENITDVVYDATVLSIDSVNHSNRIEYSILQTSHRLSELDVKRYRFSRLPSLVLFGNVSANASRNEFDIFDTDKKWYPTAIVGASLSVPIFGGFQIHAREQQAKLSKQKIENAQYLTEQSINMEFKNAKVTMQNSLEELDTQKKNRELARDVVRVSKIKYDQGVGSNLEVVDAESSLREAETNYYSALFNSMVSKIELDKALGNIKY